MKYLPVATIFLWLIALAGYLYAQDYFLQPQIKFPLFILLATFLPICFWWLAQQKKRFQALVFLLLFSMNTIFLILSALQNYSLLSTFEPHNELLIDPQLAELVVVGEDEEIREFTGRLLYENYGITLPFKREDGTFSLFTPTNENQKIYMEKSTDKAGLKLVKPRLKYQTDAVLFLLAIQLLLFTGILSLLVLRGDDGRQT